MTAEPPDGYAAYQAGTRIGFGERPGVVVVDFQLAFTDPRFPLGGSPHIARAVDNTATLLAAARRARAPVALCYTAYSSEHDAPYWKVPSVVSDFRHGWEGAELDPRLRAAGDAVFCKSAASIFFGTAVHSFLVKQRVDTLIVTGCTTSGCVRATVIDGFSHGFRVAVPEPCCGDMEDGPHRDNLRDIGRRYADVVSLDETLRYFAEIQARNSSSI